MPYTGYVDVSINVPRLGIQQSNCLLLVVPNTNYNSQVPILLGTNILTQMKESCQGKNLTKYSTAWKVAFQCLSRQDRNLKKNHGKVAEVRSSSNKPVVLPCNKTVSVYGKIKQKVVTPIGMVITQATNNSVVPDGVEVAPVLLNSHVLDKGKTINVTMTNHTDRPISVQPSGLICELQWCTPEEGLDITNNDSETDTLTGQSFDLSNCTLNEEQRDKLVSLLSNWQSVFALGENIG